MRWLGVDLGRRRIGLATSDTSGKVAFALRVMESRSLANDIESLTALAREQGVEGIVVGLPRHMDGTEGSEAKQAREYAQALEKATGLPTVLWDERLTTVVAERARREAGKKRATVDALAAALILQNYLDSLQI